jgi:hypothetical protein
MLLPRAKITWIPGGSNPCFLRLCPLRSSKGFIREKSFTPEREVFPIFSREQGNVIAQTGLKPRSTRVFHGRLCQDLVGLAQFVVASSSVPALCWSARPYLLVTFCLSHPFPQRLARAANLCCNRAAHRPLRTAIARPAPSAPLACGPELNTVRMISASPSPHLSRIRASAKPGWMCPTFTFPGARAPRRLPLSAAGT